MTRVDGEAQPLSKTKAFMTDDAVSDTIPASALRIAGITPFTTIDFPGKLAAVAFLQGCPWKCVYCQNPWMQSRTFREDLAHASWEELERLLKKRRGLLDGIVFSGGEPCTDPALLAAIKAVKAMGFKVGLHTGGAYPRRLADIVGDLDWVGLDVKAPPRQPERWEKVIRVKKANESWEASFKVLKESGIAFECRTTAHPDYLPEADLLDLADSLAEREVETWALQIYRRPPGQLLAAFPTVGADYPSEAAMVRFRSLFPHFIFRPAQ